MPPFRSQVVVAAFEACISKATRGAFRVVQYSVQADHVHLVVEAADRTTLSRGMQGLAIRLARAFNRKVRRKGKVWGDRYHARDLSTPREVRTALVYVLMNHKKHGARMPARFSTPTQRALDPYSSAAWFDGWSSRAGPWVVRLRADLPSTALPVARPRTWLARIAWRRHGLLAAHEEPASN